MTIRKNNIKFLIGICLIIALALFFHDPSVKSLEFEKEFTMEDCENYTGDEFDKCMSGNFTTKVEALKEEYGNKIDDVVLATTVLFQGDYYQSMDSQAGKDYDSEENRNILNNIIDFFSNIFNNSLSSDTSSDEDANYDDGNISVTQDEIDLLDVAALVMVHSSVNGSYNEDSYKEALMSNGLVVDEFDNKKLCDSQLNSIEIKQNDNLKTRMEDVCQYGFIGGVYTDVRSVTDEETRQTMKKNIVDEIIEFSDYYKSIFRDEQICVYTGTTGDYANWRQCDPAWADLPLGGVRTMCAIGCTTTSVAIQIARSGTQITNLPTGYSSFNPGAFVTSLSNNGGYSNGGITWSGWNDIAPNFNSGYFVSTNYPQSQESALASELVEVLNTPQDGQYQRYVILQIHHAGSTQHWVAVEGIDGNTVRINDPGLGATTLSEKYSNWVVDGYRVMWATDVPFGSTGGSSSTQANSSVVQYMNIMQSIADDNSHGYSMNARDGNPDYDCSSFIYYALLEAGIIEPQSYAFTTPYMGEILKAAGFSEIPYDINNLQTGDIIVDPRSGAQGHTTTIYSSDENGIKEIAAHMDYDHVSGDSSGDEISISDFREGSHQYRYIYRLAGATGDYCETDFGTGEIVIPEEYGNGGYTVTFYSNNDNSWNWDPTADAGIFYYQYWIPSGAKYDNGIAVYEGRYLIACTSTFGKVGDKIDFYLSDGTKIETIMVDTKNQNDAGCNEWGHGNGQNVLEFEVSRSYFNSVGSNPGNAGWFPEWGGKRVASATNLGSVFDE